MPVSGDQIMAFGRPLARTREVVVSGRRKLRIGSMVYASLSRDEDVVGFAYPTQLRPGLIASDPLTFLPPGPIDLRYPWVHARLDRLDPGEAEEFIVDAWAMLVPRFLAREEFARRGVEPEPWIRWDDPRV